MKITTFVDYFEGYTEAIVPRKYGKGYKLVRIYTGNYHVHDITDRQWVLKKLLYTGLIMATMLLYILSGVSKTSGNATVFVAAFSGLAVFSLVFTLVSCITYICNPREMTIFAWKRSSYGIKRWCFITAICLFCVATISFIHMLVYSMGNFFPELICSLGYGLSGFFALAMNKIEAKTEYYEKHNDVQIPFYPEADL